MSGVLEHLHELLNEAKAEFAKLFGHGDAEVQAVAKAATEKIDAVKSAVETDLPEVEHEVAADAGDVVHTAETQGVEPAVAEAEKDAVKVGEDAAHDVETAATGAEASNAPASETPAAP